MYCVFSSFFCILQSVRVRTKSIDVQHGKNKLLGERKCRAVQFNSEIEAHAAKMNLIAV